MVADNRASLHHRLNVCVLLGYLVFYAKQCIMSFLLAAWVDFQNELISYVDISNSRAYKYSQAIASTGELLLALYAYLIDCVFPDLIGWYSFILTKALSQKAQNSSLWVSCLKTLKNLVLKIIGTLSSPAEDLTLSNGEWRNCKQKA